MDDNGLLRVGKRAKEKYNAGKTLLYYFLVAVPLWVIIFGVPYYWSKLLEKLRGE